MLFLLKNSLHSKVVSCTIFYNLSSILFKWTYHGCNQRRNTHSQYTIVKLRERCNIENIFYFLCHSETKLYALIIVLNFLILQLILQLVLIFSLNVAFKGAFLAIYHWREKSLFFIMFFDGIIRFKICLH